MALKDFEAFCREKLLEWDPNLDASPGGPIDTTFIQPLLGRIGTDPFSTNMPLFVRERLAQEFPELALKEGDALIDLLVKGTELLLDPLVRETNRIALSQSFRDPNLLTTDESEALGANLFAYRKKGELAHVTVRAYFSTPRDKTVSPADYALSKGGLLFYPTANQSIKANEMLLNPEGSDYYFDVSTVAEGPGDNYNIGPDEIVSMPTVEDASRVTNKARAGDGLQAETAGQFIGRAEQELSEKSMNAIRGIVSKLSASFPEITRVAVVGYNDPEMERDEIVGGGIGSVISQGIRGNAFPDGKNGATTLRLRVADPADFRYLIAAPGAVEGFTITLVNAWGPNVQEIRDIDIAYVVDGKTLELVAPAQIAAGAADFQWALRRRTVTLSDIPGGIVFPDTATGTVSIEKDRIHIGGCTDIYIKGAAFDSRSFTINDVADDQPLLLGQHGLSFNSGNPNLLALLDFCDDQAYAQANYAWQTSPFSVLENDLLYQKLEAAVANGYVLDIIYPAVVAAKYKITRVHYQSGLSPHAPVIEVKSVNGTTVLFDPGEPIVWRIQDDLDVELTEPKEQKWEGYDLRTYVGTNIVDTNPSIDFNTLGVAQGDVLRIYDGNDADDHTIDSIGGAFNSQIFLTLPLKSSASGLHFTVFRANKAGGLQLPLIRPTSLALLDASQQPMGTTIPFGAPIFCTSEKFTDAGKLPKLELFDATVGIVGGPLQDMGAGLAAPVGGKSLRICWLKSGTLSNDPVWQQCFVVFNPPTVRLIQDIVDEINAQLRIEGVPSAAYIVNENRIGIAPIAPYTWVDASPTPFTMIPSGYAVLFGDPTQTRWRTPITSRDIRSDYITRSINSGWDAHDIHLDEDSLEMVTGVQIGHYQLLRNPWSLFYSNVVLNPPFPNISSLGPTRLMVDHDFNPEEGQHARLGVRSVGWARCYFLEPVTIEFGHDARFTVTLEQGGQLEYLPDPWVDAQRIPAYPDTGACDDGKFVSWDPITQTGEFQSSAQRAHFLDSGIRPGDLFTIEFQTIHGTEQLNVPMLNLAGTRLVLSVNDTTDMVISFVADPGTVTITPAHVAAQINQAVGLQVASIDAGDHLSFSADFPVVVRARGVGYANAILGFSEQVDTNNYSDLAGSYLILEVTSEYIGPSWWEKVRYRVVDKTPNTGTQYLNQHFRVMRPGCQRISATQMALNTTVSGLYYFDVQLASAGVGTLWNIPDGTEMLTSGFFTYGYQLYTHDPDMTFSMNEVPWLSLPAVYFQVGSSDDLSNSINLIGQNIQVNYDSLALIEEVQNYSSSETERVTCYSPLIRHLVPYFVRIDCTYDGGSKASIVKNDAVQYVQNLYPSQPLDSSNVQKLVTNRGSSSIDNPLEIMAVVHNIDRTVWMEWSQDRINSGRLAAFFPDVLNFTQRTG